jgi:hypothetical protein
MGAFHARLGVMAAGALAMVALAMAAVGAPDDPKDEAEARATPRPPALRDGFEGPEPSWRREETDTTIHLRNHDRSERAAHEGRLSERFHFDAGPGSALYYSYPLPRIPVVPDLTVSLFVRSDHAGPQLFARVVLPADADPETGQPSFLLVPGSIYRVADRWERLKLEDLPLEIERQARVLRVATKRPVSTKGAYLERLVVNLYGGPGETVVFLDDLVITPVPRAAATPAAPVVEAPRRPAREGPTGAAAIQFVRNRLSKDGKPWVFTAIEAPGADPDALLRHGFDVWMVPPDTAPALLRKAADHGFLLMPTLGGKTSAAEGTPEGLTALEAFPEREAVAFWDLGHDLGAVRDFQARKAELERIRDQIKALRNAPEGLPKLTTGTLAGFHERYASPPYQLDLLGIHLPNWGSSWDLRDYYRYLAQHRTLTTLKNPQALYWALIDATPPAEAHRAIWGEDRAPSWGRLVVQPEQLRIATFAALAAGYRGLAFHADADLTRAAGRALFIEMALLNAEIDLFEPVLAQGADPIEFLSVYLPDPPLQIVYNPMGTQGGLSTSGGGNNSSKKAQMKLRPEMKPFPTMGAGSIATRDGRGTLLLVTDLGVGAQWQPAQLAFQELKIRVKCPETANAFEISLGGVKVLTRERVPGGVEITLKDFGATALVLVTTDPTLYQWFDAAVTRIRPLAIAMAIEQAKLQIDMVTELNNKLMTEEPLLREKIRDAADLIKQAEKTLQSANEALEREDYPMAWTEARRVSRSLRVLMVTHHQKALDSFTKAITPPDEKAETKKYKARANAVRKKILPPKPPKFMPRLVNPCSLPPLIAFNTLPQAWMWIDLIRNGHFGRNLLPSGSFEGAKLTWEDLVAQGWRDASYQAEGLVSRVQIDTKESQQGKACLKLTVSPFDNRLAAVDTLPPFLDHPVAAVTSPPVPLKARQLVRISVKVKQARPQPDGGLGLIVRDSIGGAALQYRTTLPIVEWSEIILYRRAPADGPLTVTLGLGGYGTAYFDDLRIERLEAVK